MRKEIKIPINNNFDNYFSYWREFKNNIKRQHKDRFISSVYYDNDDYSTARNNLAGVSKRKKYRIRWYNSDDNFFYEIKYKKNNLGSKILLKSHEYHKNLKNLYSSRNTFLNKSENKFFLKKIISYNLKPKLKVTYLRSYFIYSKNVRITYDRNITYTVLDNLNIKNKNINDFMNVIEIKFKQKDLNTASSLIKKSKFVPKRFSKYLRGLYLSGISNYI